MILDDKDKQLEENRASIIEDLEFEYEEDNRVVFGKKKAIVVKEEIEEEVAPQELDEYQVESQIIDQPTTNLSPTWIDDEMKKSFIEYSMSVIVSRALPDVRDGLKPVHRRILYDMAELGLTPSSPHRKSARVVGDVLGKYHPHGDSSVYEAMVRMAQDFSMRYPLVDGHGNFGSIDGDEPAAMRYTEARMAKLSSELLEGIKKNTVDFVDNYDASEIEPSVLPARFPNLLVSGATGIAVAMATAIPPHNLGEAIDATIALAHNPEITVKELMQYLKGPDFPTGATILGTKGILDAYETGKGKIPVRSNCQIIELANGKSKIIVREIPYGIKKKTLIEDIVKLHKDKAVEGITDLRDESSNREGIRIVIEVKKGVNPHILLNKLYQKSQLQTNFNANMVALVKGEPKLLNLKQILEIYFDYQKEVVTRRLQFDLSKAQERAHILDGLKIAVSNIDEVVKIIRGSKTDQEAQEKLMTRFSLDEKQSKAILDMSLRRLTGLNIEKMEIEIAELKAEIAGYLEILNSEQKLIETIVEELKVIKDKYNDERRTKIDESNAGIISDEDLIPEREIVITASVNGYVKRIDLEDYTIQNRGGIGSIGMKTYNNDDISMIIQTSTHTDLLLFSNFGKAYQIRAHQIPEGSKNSKGIPLINVIPTLDIENGEKIVSILDVAEYSDNLFLGTITEKGLFKKTALSAFANVRRNGLNAFKLNEGDILVRAFKLSDQDLILVANNDKNIVKFKADDVRPLGRTALGVRAIKLEENQKVISCSSNLDGEYILSIGNKGFGKLTPHQEYRLTKRGAKGTTGIDAKKAGNLVFASFVKLEDELLIITASGITIRTKIAQISQTSRNTKGVKIINLRENDEIVAIDIIKNQE
ncbi:DNA gyrase subunit A [Mycoplasmopsis gallopavonis]|uniref:DNA gyrase subunit A n=1 Tax=Mycoplasmopsis gallopavonis TaxID=76629 RepID=A0A449AZI3_9BACT|nr:DNA gyrase subunit A [Mycoplasmopsis gallopavonis]RIV16414.1 DNA gyrase subunit A [Mycoplasmopsis gallopavonis]VEU72866.1 DNA gyrase, A subunit [Mycoplasmopsis gallopavonis]